MKYGLFALAAFVLAGCATSSGVYKTGQDSYAINTAAWTSMGGQGAAWNAALKQANATCASQGKETIVDQQGGDTKFTGATVDLKFRCVAK